jgi:hypothetical protein
MSQSTPPQQPPQQPPQAPPQAPGVYPQPPYPYAPPWGYGYYPWYGPRPTQPPTPVERPVRPGRARLANIIIAALAAASLVVALALAAVAPAFSSHPPDPTGLGFHQIYDAPLTDDPGHWDVGKGCVFEQGGLHAPVNTTDATGTICPFTPSVAGDITSQGFYLTAEVGGAAAVGAQQQPCIGFESAGAAYELTFDQSGNYILKTTSTGPCGDDPGGGAANGIVAWHTDGYTHNRIGVLYSAADRTTTIYINDQVLVQVPLGFSDPVKIDLGASGGGEAIFTRFTFYSGNAG